MDQDSKDKTKNIAVAVASIIMSVIGSNGIIDYRASERTSTVAQNVGDVAAQNKEILIGIKHLLEEELAKPKEIGQHNSDLNMKIIELTTQQNELLSDMQKVLQELKAAKR